MMYDISVKLIAKLKAVFDKFDEAKSGMLDALQVRHMLLYMNRDVDDVKVNLACIDHAHTS
jgi:hypothetical protein